MKICVMCNNEFITIGDLCPTCANGQPYIRYCSTCNKMIKHKSEIARECAINHGRLCQQCGCGWNKGLSKETSISIQKQSVAASKKLKSYYTTHTPWNKGLTKETNSSLAIISEKIKGNKHTTETKEKISNASIEHWKSPEYREKVICNMSIGIRKSYVEGRKKPINKDTKPELAVESILKELNIQYTKQYPIWASYPRPYKYVRFFDFYLPEYKKIIEVNGNYWHGKNLTQEECSPIQLAAQHNDIHKKCMSLDRNIELFYIWEDETKNKNILYAKISEILSAHYKLAFRFPNAVI